MIAIPAMDMIQGKCVRLYQGDYSQMTEYSGDPITIAQQLEESGIKYLHWVDLEGAREGKPINRSWFQAIAKATKLHIDVGGGIGKTDDAQWYLDHGASQITAGSVAVTNPTLMKEWLQIFGKDRVILGVDVLKEIVKIRGWETDTKIHWEALISSYLDLGLHYIICTDIGRDGSLKGPSTHLYKKILKRFPSVQLIASGGISSEKDLIVLQESGLHGAIIGKAWVEQVLPLKTLALYQT